MRFVKAVKRHAGKEETSIGSEVSMSRSSLLLAVAFAVSAVTPANARGPDDVARCLQLAGVYERHVSKNWVAHLPSMSTEFSVIIELCRQGKVIDGSIERLQSALLDKGFRPQ